MCNFEITFTILHKLHDLKQICNFLGSLTLALALVPCLAQAQRQASTKYFRAPASTSIFWHICTFLQHFLRKLCKLEAKPPRTSCTSAKNDTRRLSNQDFHLGVRAENTNSILIALNLNKSGAFLSRAFPIPIVCPFIISVFAPWEKVVVCRKLSMLLINDCGMNYEPRATRRAVSTTERWFGDNSESRRFFTEKLLLPRQQQYSDRYQTAGPGKTADNYRASRWSAFSISENDFIIKLFSILRNYQCLSRRTGLLDSSHRRQPLALGIQRLLESCKWVHSLFLLMQCEEAKRKKKIKIHSLKPAACARLRKVGEGKPSPRVTPSHSPFISWESDRVRISSLVRAKIQPLASVSTGWRHLPVWTQVSRRCGKGGRNISRHLRLPNQVQRTSENLLKCSEKSRRSERVIKCLSEACTLLISNKASPKPSRVISRRVYKFGSLTLERSLHARRTFHKNKCGDVPDWWHWVIA